ncbi:uncharacterized protein VTP21DRAFT_403 [Calcarisporiella thermophila]|uniref:uncharacterized protein n=1 Tax=Calcarisporiella thermophila TaxID=911321 RepID=UPI0037444A4F
MPGTNNPSEQKDQSKQTELPGQQDQKDLQKLCEQPAQQEMERRPSLEPHDRRRVLMCLDSSDFAKEAFEWSIKNLLRPGSDHVVLATSVERSGTPIRADFRDHAVGNGLRRRMSEVEQEKGTEMLRPLAERLVEFGVTAQVWVLKGDPKEKLVELSKKLNIDMVIVGSRGRGLLKSQLLGSVSSYLVHHCECPVIVAKSKKTEHTPTRRRSVIGIIGGQ